MKQYEPPINPLDIPEDYPEKNQEQLEQKLRLSIRNSEIQFDSKLLETLKNLSTAKQD